MLRTVGVCALFIAPAFAADAPWPTKPIRMIVAVPPGGPADTLSRLVSPKLTEALGRPVIIDNRPGANGNIAYELTARATPDGHTFTAVAAGVVINPSLYPNVAYDPLKDFAPITLGITLPNILVVHPSVAAKSVKELIALAKVKPGTLAFASAGNGTSGHLALELFKMSAGIDVIHVPYKGGGPALAEVVAGQVQALFSLALVATPQIKAGKLRGLAITSAKRSPVAPELPTVAESGLPGFEVIGWFGWLAPAAMPRAHRDSTQRRARVRAASSRCARAASEPGRGARRQYAAGIRRIHEKRTCQVGEGDQGGKRSHRVIARYSGTN